MDEFTKVVGCHRKAAIRLYLNFFQPVMKLVAKTRHGTKRREMPARKW